MNKILNEGDDVYLRWIKINEHEVEVDSPNKSLQLSYRIASASRAGDLNKKAKA